MIDMASLIFGSSGIAQPPLAPKKLDSVTNVAFVKKIGLQAMELAFVHGVFMKPMLAARVRKEVETAGIKLTVHAPYYINLNPKPGSDGAGSKSMLLQAAKIGALAGARDIAFHPGSYLKQAPEEAYEHVKKNLLEVADELRMQKIPAILRPEIGGKLGVFGTLEELIELSKLRDNIRPCIDFAHLVGRTQGAVNSYEGFCGVFEQIRRELGSEAVEDIHIQFAGIAYTTKGEKNHLNFAECDFDYKALARAFVDCGVGGIAICESPDKEQDALLMKKEYEKIVGAKSKKKR